MLSSGPVAHARGSLLVAYASECANISMGKDRAERAALADECIYTQQRVFKCPCTCRNNTHKRTHASVLCNARLAGQHCCQRLKCMCNVRAQLRLQHSHASDPDDTSSRRTRWSSSGRYNSNVCSAIRLPHTAERADPNTATAGSHPH